MKTMAARFTSEISCYETVAYTKDNRWIAWLHIGKDVSLLRERLHRFRHAGGSRDINFAPRVFTSKSGIAFVLR
jgi:hypothetical protein